uniref:Uncharacterized protein n=1 Tax=Musca domestica TaxID=7370 RepID=A0A1I8MAI4_MUSDO
MPYTTDYVNSSSNSGNNNNNNSSNNSNNLVLENLHINRHHIDNINPINSNSYSSSPPTNHHSANATTQSDVSTASAAAAATTIHKSSHCTGSHGRGGNSPTILEKKKCLELQSTSGGVATTIIHNSNNNNNLLDTTGDIDKGHCCMATSLTSISSSVSSTAVVTALPSTDITREQWYVHHTPAHPQHQLPEEFVMYAPTLPTSGSASSIGKFGIESSTESYLNSRYNVNVKGVRHERTSSFFDIPAVTHPYPYPNCYRLNYFVSENSFCNNSVVSSSLQFGQHFHNSKAEHPDSTTTSHLSNPHNPAAHPHAHHHPHHHTFNPHHHPHHLSPHHSSAFKFSHSNVLSSTSPPSVYHHHHHPHHQYSGQNSSSAYGLRTSSDITSLTLAPVSTTSEVDIKYENPYNTAISSSYALRSGNCVDSSTGVSSSDSDFKLESLYAANNGITTSHTVSQRRGSLQLWQFLVALLDEPTTNSSCIAWTGRGMEFKLIEPEEVARRWGIQKNRPAMNYDKLSRSLRYYYEKGIMQKVNGERYVYRFVCDPEALFNMAYGHLNAGSNSTGGTGSKIEGHQHHHHAHHGHGHLLPSVGKNNLDAGLLLRDTSAPGALDDDSTNRERSSTNHISIAATKHHEQLYYGKF